MDVSNMYLKKRFPALEKPWCGVARPQRHESSIVPDAVADTFYSFIVLS